MNIAGLILLLKRTPILAVLATLSAARADAVTEWNERTSEIVTASGLPTPPASRVARAGGTSRRDRGSGR